MRNTNHRNNELESVYKLNLSSAAPPMNSHIRFLQFDRSSPEPQFLACLSSQAHLFCCAKDLAMRMTSSLVVWGMLAVLGMSIAVQEAQAQCAGADLNKLSACLPASSAANVMPTPACCQALANFNSGNGEACLCAASTDPRFTSSGAKAQYAILIPQKCNLKYKAGYVCNGVVIPGGQ